MSKSTKTGDYIEWAVLLLAILGTFWLFNANGLGDHLKPETRADKIIMFIGIFIMAFITLGIHELGHLLTGLFQGFTFQLFVVGPLGIKREDDQIKVYFNTNLSYYGGVAATSPAQDHPDNAKKFARLILAGPLASLVFALICFLISGVIGRPLGIVVYTAGMISIALFYATTIPSKTGMFFTDRKRYQRLTTPGKDQDTELAMLRITGQYAQDHSYRNVDKKDIKQLVNEEMPFLRFYGLYNLICYQLELEHQVDVAVEEEYQAMSEEMPKSVVAAFETELEKMREKHLISKDIA